MLSAVGQYGDGGRATLVAMRPPPPRRAVLPLLAAVVLTLAGPPAAAPAATARAELGTPTVRSRTVEFGPGRVPQAFTVPCAPGEHLLSGGHASTDQDLRVLASLPSDEQGLAVAGGSQPRAWTVRVLDERASGGTLRISALCLAGSEVTAGVFASPPATGAAIPPQAQCPAGTARSGGGHAAEWHSRLGAAAVTGSRPAGERGWAVDAALSSGQALRATEWITTYAVCLTGPVRPIAVEDVEFGLDTLARECLPGVAANVCLVPRLGVATAYCPPGSLATGGGHQLLDPAPLREYRLLENGPSAYATWTVRAAGYSSGTSPVRMRLSPVCLFPAATPDAPVKDLLPDSGADRNRALALGGGLLALLLLALLALLAVRRARRRAEPAAGIEVVVRQVRTRYRTDAYREDL